MTRENESKVPSSLALLREVVGRSPLSPLPENPQTQIQFGSKFGISPLSNVLASWRVSVLPSTIESHTQVSLLLCLYPSNSYVSVNILFCY